MKLYSFPQAVLEKAIAKRIMGLEPMHREWFVQRWSQKPYKKAFIENKAMPLITFLAKGKSWDQETFDTEMNDWDVKFYESEAEVLRPMIQGDGLIKLMQKAMPEERIVALLQKIEDNIQVG